MFCPPVGKFIKAVTLLAVALAWLAGAASGGAQELTGVIYGKVAADDGAMLPGVTITVSSPQLIGGGTVQVTNNEGAYRVSNLPPGTYIVKAELPGFQTVSRENVPLSAGTAVAIDFRLGISAIEETVTVVGESPLVDVRRTQTMRTVDSALVEALPTGRGFADIIVTVPGVVDTQYGFAPAQTVHGSTPRDNQYNVDGANVNDTAVGYMFTEIPYDIIEEVQVTTGGISAEFGQASGAVFNFITKSGGNSLHGEGNLFIQNEKLRASNITDELQAQGLPASTGVKELMEYGASAGGPILRDRIWYFGNIRWFDSEQIQPDFPVQNPRIDDLQSFIKLTAQLTESTRVQGSFTYRDRDQFPSNAGFQRLNAPESWSRAWRDQRVVFLSGTHVFGKSTLFEGNFSQSLQQAGSSFGLDEPGYVDQVTSLVYGGWGGISGPTRNRDNRVIKAKLTQHIDRLWGGSHDVKVGYENAFAPFLWIRLIPGDMLHLVRNRQPFRVRLYNTPVDNGANASRHTLFFQDEWTLRDRLALNLGVRFDMSECWLPEQPGGGGRWFPQVVYPERRDVIVWKEAAPRLGAVWDVVGDKTTSVKVSYGRYYELLLNQHGLYANTNTTGFLEYDWTDLNGDNVFQDGEQGTLRADTRGSLNQVDPDVKQPYVDALHIGLDRQLGNNFAVSVAGIFKWERDLIETIQVATPFSAYNPLTVTNPVSGEQMTIYALDPSYQGVQRVRRLTTPTDPVKLYRDYKGLEIVVRRRMANKWQFNASLNYGRSRGNLGNSFGQSTGGASMYDDPNTLINSEGPLDMDMPWQIKLQGSYEVPYGVVLSANYAGLSGYPIWEPADFPSNIAGAQTVRFTRANHPGIVVESFIDVTAEPRGSRRIDFRNLLAVRAEKRFQLGRAQVALAADVFNILNINTVLFVQTLQYGHPNQMKPARIEQPRNLRLGLRVLF